jgi:hypothetical protein
MLTGGQRWVGRFEGGAGGITGAFATPNPGVVCIVVSGQGFWVPVESPAQFELVRATPIKTVLAVGLRLMVFVDNTRLAAYADNGFRWMTTDLSWDGIRVTEVGQDQIRGIGFDSPSNREVPFLVATTDGSSEGGSSPDQYRQ